MLAAGAPPGMAPGVTLDEVVADHVRRILARTDGRIEGPRGAAVLLGIHPSTLRARMRKLGIPFGRRTRTDSEGAG